VARGLAQLGIQIELLVELDQYIKMIWGDTDVFHLTLLITGTAIFASTETTVERHYITVYFFFST